MSTNGAYKIEDGVALPPPRGKGAGLRNALEALVVGQSIFVPAGEHATVSAAGRNAAKRANDGRQYTTRRVDGGLRIWRIA